MIINNYIIIVYIDRYMHNIYVLIVYASVGSV